MIPPPEGFHEVRYRPDGTMIGRGPSKEDEAKRLAKRKADMARYEARTKEAQEKVLKRAAGIKEPGDIPPPKDVLDLTVMNLLADPGLLDGHGAGEGVRTLSETQRRERQREQMNARALESRKALDKFIKGEDDAEWEEQLGWLKEGDDEE
jgi:hypothetical protein